MPKFREPIFGQAKSPETFMFQGFCWSGWRDLNSRPLEPHSSTLPSCATPSRSTANRILPQFPWRVNPLFQNYFPPVSGGFGLCREAPDSGICGCADKIFRKAENRHGKRGFRPLICDQMRKVTFQNRVSSPVWGGPSWIPGILLRFSARIPGRSSCHRRRWE